MIAKNQSPSIHNSFKIIEPDEQTVKQNSIEQIFMQKVED